jgi:biopolymer transport protein ExbB
MLMSVDSLFQPLYFALAQTTPTPAAREGKTLLEHIQSGGWIGHVIVLLSIVALGLVIAHFIQVRRARLAPPEVVTGLRNLLRAGDLQGAIRACQDEVNDSFLTRVLGAALLRCSKSPFGLMELRTALEESGQEQVTRLHRSTDGIGLIASVAPMLGLLGTVVGMVGAFETIADTEGVAKPYELAGYISIALITTVEGLIVAIPCTAVYTYARNRIDRLTGEVGVLIEEMMGEIEGVGSPGGAAPARPHAGPSPRPIPPPAGSMPRPQPSGGGAVGGARGA